MGTDGEGSGEARMDTPRGGGQKKDLEDLVAKGATARREGGANSPACSRCLRSWCAKLLGD